MRLRDRAALGEFHSHLLYKCIEFLIGIVRRLFEPVQSDSVILALESIKLSGTEKCKRPRSVIDNCTNFHVRDGRCGGRYQIAHSRRTGNSVTISGFQDGLRWRSLAPHEEANSGPANFDVHSKTGDPHIRYLKPAIIGYRDGRDLVAREKWGRL